MDGRTDGHTHGQTDEGHFYSPPPPTLGDKKLVTEETWFCLAFHLQLLEANYFLFHFKDKFNNVKIFDILI